MPHASRKSLLLSTFYSALSELSIVLLFLLFILAARYLGTEDFGIFSFALAYAGLFSVINDFGLRYVLLRDVSRDKDSAEIVYGNTIAIQIVFSIVAVSFGVIVMYFFQRTEEVYELMFMMLFAESLRVAKLLFRFVYRAYNRFQLEAKSVFIERVVLLVAGFAVLAVDLGLYWFVLSFVLVRIVDVSISFYLTFKVLKPEFKIELSRIKYLIVESVPFGLVGVCMILMLKIDTVMISIFRGDADVGIYNAATKLVEGLSIVSAVLINVLIPAASKKHDDSQFLSALFGSCTRYIILIAFPLVFLGIQFSNEIILMLYGDDYIASAMVLNILLSGLIFTYMYSIGGAILGAINRQKITFYASLLALAANLISNIILIPALGYVGAAISTVLSSVAFCIFIVANLHFHSIKTISLGNVTWPLFASMIAGVSIYVIEGGFLLSIFVFPLIYIVVLSLLNFWNVREKEFMAKQLFLIKNRFLKY